MNVAARAYAASIPRQERAAAIGLGLVMAVTAAVIALLNVDVTFFNDEFGWLTLDSDYTPYTILTPHNGHLIASVRLLYESAPRAFGASHLPFVVALGAAVLTCGGLFFAFARKRVGGVLALPLTAVLLLLGTAWNVIGYPIGIPVIFSTVLGLWALVTVERDGVRWNITTCALLLLAVASDSFGLVFGVGIATYVLLHPDRRRDSWVFLVPAFLYVLWWIWALRFDQGLVDYSNIVRLPIYAIESLGAIVASLLGLNVNFTDGPETLPPGFNWSLVFLLGPVAAVAFVLRVRRVGFSPWLITLIVVLGTFWIALGLVEGVGREATTGRYMFPGALIVLLVGVELARGATVSRRTALPVYVLAAVSIAAGATHLHDGRQFMVQYTDDARAQLAMIELAGEAGNPGLIPSLVLPGGAYVAVSAAEYLANVPTAGSLAYSLTELEQQPEGVRERADLVLTRSYGVLAIPASMPDTTSGCLTHRESQDGQVTFPLDPGESVVTLIGGETQPLSLGRFGDTATAPIGTLAADQPVRIPIPSDDASAQWFGQAGGPVRVCSTKSPAAT